MKAVARRWVVTTALGMSAAMVGSALAADVTDADRTYRNFTREAATLRAGQIRIEVRGMKLEDNGEPVLNVAGFRLRSLYGEVYENQENRNRITNISAGQLDLVTSYGIADNAEVGVIVPGMIETTRWVAGKTINDSNNREEQDIGDLQLYGKFRHQVADNCNVAGGVELSMPNGPTSKGFGTGELGVTPFVSTRYQKGPVALGVSAGYQFYSGSPDAVDNTFHYGAQVIVRGGETWALRTEIAGRVFRNGGTQFNDLTVLPGIDYRLSDNITLRPTGIAGGTSSAMDWGLGLGIAATL